MLINRLILLLIIGIGLSGCFKTLQNKISNITEEKFVAEVIEIQKKFNNIGKNLEILNIKELDESTKKLIEIENNLFLIKKKFGLNVYGFTTRFRVDSGKLPASYVIDYYLKNISKMKKNIVNIVKIQKEKKLLHHKI